MFASNNKVSVRQVYRLFVFDLIGMGTLVLPSRLAFFSEGDGLWAIGLGGLLAALYLLYLGKIVVGMKTDFAAYMERALPAWLMRALLALLGLHAVFTAGFGAYIFSDVMKRGLVPEESFSLILFLIILVSAYAVHGGIESRSRIYEVLFGVIGIGLLVMFVIASFDLQWDYIGPFFESSPASVAKGAMLVFFCCMPIFAVIFFPAYVEAGKEKKMLGAVFAALVTAIVVLAVMYFILLGSFGGGALKTMRYPAVTLMSNIHLSSSFLKRFDAFMLGIWFFTLFALLNLFLFYGTELLMRAFMGKGNQAGEEETDLGAGRGRIFWLGGAAVLTFAAAELCYYMDWSMVYLNYVCYVGMPLLVLLPGLVYAAGKVKK